MSLSVFRYLKVSLDVRITPGQCPGNQLLSFFTPGNQGARLPLVYISTSGVATEFQILPSARCRIFGYGGKLE
jgi:hypothetical protein